ncbi:MAG: SRPBCC family protein [Anaerolineae bacterium]|nr:SRPBCC family protein [Anaerolineae bacterium]
MPHVEETIYINAPVERVFEFIANQPERMPEWWPPMTLQERVTPAPTGLGSVSRYVYSMVGLEIKGEHEVREFDPPRRLVVTTTSGIDSTFDYTFSAEGEGCNLAVRVDYELPGGFLGRIANKVVVERKNVEDLRAGLQNLKSLLEG